MGRLLEISRDEAEMLTDVLMLTDSPFAGDVSDQIRALFGMVTEEQELKKMGKTRQDVRRAAFNAGVAAERERCALQAEAWDDYSHAVTSIGPKIARAIRGGA